MHSCLRLDGPLRAADAAGSVAESRLAEVDPRRLLCVGSVHQQSALGASYCAAHQRGHCLPRNILWVALVHSLAAVFIIYRLLNATLIINLSLQQTGDHQFCTRVTAISLIHRLALA